MTTQKAQSKIKSSTVAITVLSILLAIAVVSTIVLAAFTATKTGTTTITFGDGLTLTVTGDDVTSGGEEGDTSFTISKTNLSATADATVGTVTATASEDAFIAYKITPSASGTNNSESFTLGAVNSTGATTSQTLTWAINRGSTQVATLTVVFGTGLSYDTDAQAIYNATAATSIVMFQSITITTSGAYTVNDLAGLTISDLAVEVAAVSKSGEGTSEMAIAELAD